MKNNKKKTINDEIDLKDIIHILFVEKYLILSFCLIGILLGYFISKTYFPVKLIEKRSYITVPNIMPGTLDIFELYVERPENGSESHLINRQMLTETYKDNYKYLLTSEQNMKEFLTKYKNDKLFEKLRKDNIDLSNHFRNKFHKVDDSNDEYKYNAKYYLSFQDNFDGKQFLNNYFIFSKQKLDNEFKKYLKTMMNNTLVYWESEYQIALKLGITKPIFFYGDYDSSIYRHHAATTKHLKNTIFYIGSIALNERIELLKIYIKNIDKLNFGFLASNLENSTYPEKIMTKNRDIFLIYLFMTFGFVLSLFVVFIKNLFNLRTSK